MCFTDTPGEPGSVNKEHKVPWECQSSTKGSLGVSVKHMEFTGSVTKAHRTPFQNPEIMEFGDSDL